MSKGTIEIHVFNSIVNVPTGAMAFPRTAIVRFKRSNGDHIDLHLEQDSSGHDRIVMRSVTTPMRALGIDAAAANMLYVRF